MERTFSFTMCVSPRNFLPLLICHDCKLALDMGVPIYGIVVLTTTATDKIGRSIPAPEQGAPTTALEAASDSVVHPPTLSIGGDNLSLGNPLLSNGVRASCHACRGRWRL